MNRVLQMLEQNGQHYVYNIFKHVFMNENYCIMIQISLKFVPKRPIDNKSALIKVMAWCWAGNKPLPVCITIRSYSLYPFVISLEATAYLFDGLVQERRNSIADALELRLSCTNPSIWTLIFMNSKVWHQLYIGLMLFCFLWVFYAFVCVCFLSYPVPGIILCMLPPNKSLRGTITL